MAERDRNIAHNPFPGLRPFRPNEKHLFFGRESQTDRMITKLAANRFLAVVGGSGSGKSSLVNCGLRPALHRGYMAQAGANWRVAVFRPGSSPIDALARALAKPGVLFDEEHTGPLTTRDLVDSTLRLGSLGLIKMVDQADLPQDTQLLVVVDQFEELFRYKSAKDDTGEAETEFDNLAFVRLLLEATAQTDIPIYVVITMRSDFLGDCVQFPGLPEAINEGQYLVPRLTREQIRSVITGPAGVAGGQVDSVLVTRLLNDVGDDPDQLSILQHALNRTWAHWQNERGAEGPLKLEDYIEIGTMDNALNLHAEKAFDELDRNAKKLCEKVFKTLTDVGTDARGIRRMTQFERLSEITGASFDALKVVFAVFRKSSRSFLMPPEGEELEPDADIDISHESLMRLWVRLRKWAEEEAQSAKLFRDLRDRARQHSAGKAGLLREPDLGVFMRWRQRVEPNVAWASLYGGGFGETMSYLDKSYDQDRFEAAEQDGKRRRRRAWVVLALIATLPAFAVLFVSQIISAQENWEATKAFQRDLDTLIAVCDRDNLRGYLSSGEYLSDKPGSNPMPIIRNDCLEGTEAGEYSLFLKLTQDGEIEEALKIMSNMPADRAIPARQVLELVADMQVAGVERERQCLTAYLSGHLLIHQRTGAYDNQGFRCASTPFDHQVHASMFEHIRENELEELGASEWYYLHRFFLIPRGHIPNKSNEHRPPDWFWGNHAPSDVRSDAWFYQRMELASLRVSIFEKAREWVVPFTGVFLLAFAWPIWWILRKLQQRRGEKISPDPTALRRAFATVFDLGFALIVGLLVGGALWTLPLLLSSDQEMPDTEIPVIAGIITVHIYILFSDAIHLRYRRSLGKAAFNLRPVALIGDNRGHIGFLASARRNMPKILALHVVSIVFMFLVLEIEFDTWFESTMIVGVSFVVLIAIVALGGLIQKVRNKNLEKTPLPITLTRRKTAKTLIAFTPLPSLLLAGEFGVWGAIFYMCVWTFYAWPYVLTLALHRALVPTSTIDADSALSRQIDAPRRYVIEDPDAAKSDLTLEPVG